MINEHEVVELTPELDQEIENMPIDEYIRILKPTCSCCERTYVFKMSKEETERLIKYESYGRSMGYLQDLFSGIPGWIRSGAIDQNSDGFCLCPDCCC